ncbi:Dynein heavy chain, partial [Globisporangium splendens]
MRSLARGHEALADTSKRQTARAQATREQAIQEPPDSRHSRRIVSSQQAGSRPNLSPAWKQRTGSSTRLIKWTWATKSTNASSWWSANHTPLFRVEVNLLSATPPSIGAIAASANRNNGSTPRFVRRASGFLALNPAKSPSPTRENLASHPSLSSDLLTFTPNTELMRSQVETLIFNGLKAVTNRQRLLCNAVFRVYVETSMDDGLGGSEGGDGGDGSGEISSESMDLDILIMEDINFIETLQAINSIVLDAYDLAEETCRSVTPFLEKYQASILFCKQISDPRYLENSHVEELRDLLEKYTKELRAFDELPDVTLCGLLLLDNAKLNAVLKPSPRKCLERLHVLIPLVIRHKNECVMQELSASNEQISSIPTSVDEFAATLGFLRQLQADMDNFDDRYSMLRNLYMLVEDFNIKITDADQTNAFLVSHKKAQLRTSMELFENSCDQYTTKFGIELEARIPGLATQLNQVSKTLAHPSLFQVESNPNDMIEYMSNVEKQLADLEEVVDKHFYYEKTLGLPQTTAFDEMEDVKLDLTLKMDLWKALNSWNGTVLEWEKLAFPTEVNVIAITENIQDYYVQVTSWEKNLSPGMHLLCAHLKAKIEEYRLTMPILTDSRCPYFEERHFTELQTLLGFSIRGPDRSAKAALTLGALVKMQLAPFGTQINRIATEATQERVLKVMLDKIVGMWEHMEFEVKPYKDAKDSYVLVSYENIYASLEESLRLAIFQETLDAWVECQCKWMHLESIFVAPDIQKQLPNEGILFVVVNQFWKDLMRRARDQKNCLKVSGALFFGFGNNSSATVSAGAGHAVLDTMLKHNASLERIEKSLEDYLETKRGFFPRFYFISNDELLEILAHAKEPQAVQRHLCECFDALVKLELSEDSNHGIGNGGTGGSNYYDIVAMVSPEGERVSFGRVLKARGNVEDWLNAVLTTMKATLHRHIKSCLLDYQHASRENWLFRHPAQAVAVVSYIIWARECETCFRSASHDPIRELKLWHQTICTQLSNLTRLVRTSLSPLQRSTVVSLVTTDVHFRDVVEDLIEKKVTSVDDFVWAQQLRYNWQPEHDVCVITPLTDRCWMTITGALELRFGAAPSGSAGTGKTETSKDLAKALGILCIVFNCSDQIDYKMMGKIFNGVIQAGSWTCLDEFNRIGIEVLSVVAQQMHVLRHARLANNHDVFFEGKQVALRDHHVIITMNPGYVGRTELPDNLKVCFRPVAMMVPDYAQIAEILLFAEGFQTAKILSRKVTKLFKLCSEQLSQQPHYDFGMRSVKSVLTIAGTLKRVVTAVSSLSSHLDENLLLIRAMYDANIPKFIDEDIPLFRGILRDLFPETLSSSFQGDDGLLHAATSGVSSWMASLDEEVDHQLVLHGLQIVRKWKTKIIELFTALDVRIGVVQTGASGSGKSTAMRILKESLTTLRDVIAHPSKKFQRVVSFVLNPKSISMCELYGFFHPITREWTDGLASSILRVCITEKSEQLMNSQPKSNGNHGGSPSDGGPYYWITFDGPIDVLWIESMNTVLDDNVTLCLANGERIKLLPRIQLLFEVLDTASASPATISRLGVVYYHPGNLGWGPYVETWAATLAIPVPSSSKEPSSNGNTKSTMMHFNAKHKARVLKYFELFVESGFSFLHSQTSSKTVSSSHKKIPIATSDLTFVTTICHIFQSLLAHRVPSHLFVTTSVTFTSSSGGPQAAAAAVAALEQQRNRCLDLLFFFGFTWSFGGNLYLDDFKKPFQEFVHRQILSHEHFLSKDLLGIHGKILTPRGMSQVMDNIQDFFIDFQHFSFSPWENLTLDLVQRSIDYHSDIPLSQVLVPTTDVVRYTYMTELLVIDAKKSVFVTGATGSGKSVIMNHLLGGYARSLNEPTTSPTMETAAVESSDANRGRVVPIALHFSAQTSSAVTQLSLESKLAKKRKTILGAPVKTRLVVIFIDDINLPTAEHHGAQPPIELLRQYLEFRGFYDRDKFSGKKSPTRFCLLWEDYRATIMSAHIAFCGTFSKSVKDVLLQLVDTTCQLYQVVARELLPTPSKCHYLFNLRDVTKLIQGMVLGTRRYSRTVHNAESAPVSALASAGVTVDTVVKLWAHESIRVFRDRLVQENDRKWFSEQLVLLANSNLGFSWTLEHIYDGGRSGRRQSSGVTKCVPLIFGVMSAQLHAGGGRGERNVSYEVEQPWNNYEEISDLKQLEDELDSTMARYNELNRKTNALQLVFFCDAIIHIVAISRIMIQPRGHALLLGMSGSGKRSLTRLAAFLNGYSCCEVEVKKNCSITDFREDLKAMMLETVFGKRNRGGGGTKSASLSSGRSANVVPTVLLLNDSQLVSDGFLDDINTLLSGGEIPKLFSLEEREKIITEIRTMQSSTKRRQSGGNHAMLGAKTNHGQGLPASTTGDQSRKECEEYFFTHVQKNMHVVVCLSPIGETFRARIREFPSLINCTTIDFFDEWPSTALQYVADRFLSQTPQNGNGSSGLGFPTKNALGLLCVEIHQSIGHEVVEFFAKHKRKVYITPQHFLDLIALFGRLLRENRGLLESKLQRLTTGVPILVEKTKEAELLLERVVVDQTEAREVAERVALDESKVKQQQQEVATCQADAQSDLDRALPALNAAVTALDSLDKKDITEVKGFVKPPQAVQVVMEAVCIMLGEKTDWDTSKRVLSRSTFMSELKEYDKDNIPQATLKKVRKYIDNPDFAVDEVKKVSTTPESGKSTTGLSEERVRWKQTIEQLKDEGKSIIGDSFLAAACISYLGPFDGHFRTKIARRWVAYASNLVDVSASFTLEDACGDSMELREWQLLGLPSDSVSAQNAVCIMKGKERWPLMIDPQQQAGQWIKRMEAPNDLGTLKSNENSLMKVVEDCLVNGRPLLIEDVAESIEPPLEPVLSRHALTSNSTGTSKAYFACVTLGDRVIEVNMQKFRLYMTTKLANPQFIPDVFIRMNVINFTVTISQDRKLLHQIEIKILSLLSDAKGNILDDLELIHALDTSKQTSIVVTKWLKESEVMKHEVLEIRNHYSPVAARGALLYFVIADLAAFDPTYQYSLEYFGRLFNLSIDEAPASSELLSRLDNLTAHLTFVVYRNICRGLFEAHKLLFSLVICLRVQVMNDELSHDDVHLLDSSVITWEKHDTIHGGEQDTSASRPSETRPEQRDITDVLLALGDKSQVFRDLLETYRREPMAWKSWIASSNPYTACLPSGWDELLPRFYRLVLIRWLREEALVEAVKVYISESLGSKFVISENLSMNEVLADMDKVTPCLFILSSGADPKSILDRFAREKAFYDEKYHVTSLGQGQGPVAEGMMENCMQNGHWLALLNVHLAKSWLIKLQQFLAMAKEDRINDVHQDYRLYLASFPAEYFPITILQNSVKVICEPPKGIKANLRRSMALLTHLEDTPDNVDDKDAKIGGAWLKKVEHQLAFGLSFFHAVIQERAKFGTLGWNLRYDFSDADLLSVLTLQRRLLYGAERSRRKQAIARRGSVRSDTQQDDDVDSDDDEENDNGEDASAVVDMPRNTANRSTKKQRQRIPWDALHFLTAEIYYGGRVTDEFDRRCLMANLQRFCSAAALSLINDAHMVCPIDPVEDEEASSELFPLHGDQFYCPEFENRTVMSIFVDNLPSMDSPYMFGMHPNAHIYYQKQEAERLVGELMQLQPYGQSSGDDRESARLSAEPSESIEQIAIRVAQEVHHKLPLPRRYTPDPKTSAPDGLVDPFMVVLQQELAKCHSLLQYVHERLDAAQEAIQGLVVMSHCIEDVVHSLAMHQVPLEWQRKDGTATVSSVVAFTASSTSPSLGHWVTRLLFRYEFLHHWLSNGAPPHNVFPLSVFCFPQGLFTAILQRHARKYLIPIHHLEFQFVVVAQALDELPSGSSLSSDDAHSDNNGDRGDDNDEEAEASLDGAYISGMFLEGAQWNEDKHMLCDPEPGVMHHLMPIIHVLPHSTAAPTPGAPALSNAGSTAAASRARMPAHAGSYAAPSYAIRAPVVPNDDTPTITAQVEDETKFTYACPVYKTPARKGTLSTTGMSTNFVIAIELPSERPATHYALNGTALVCSIHL